MTVADQYCESRRTFFILGMRVKLPNRRASRASWRRTITCGTGTRRFTIPRVQVPDPLNSVRLRSFGVSVTVGGLRSRIDSARGVWKTPAGSRVQQGQPIAEEEKAEHAD